MNILKIYILYLYFGKCVDILVILKEYLRGQIVCIRITG